MLGGGLLLAVAAALWLVYLVPNWLRNREYLSTERNAVRLQQTIRVLAETAETPEAVRVESAARAKVLARELAGRPVAVGAPVSTPLPASLDPRALATSRLRRTRLVVTILTALAAVGVLTQAVIAIVGGLAAVTVPLAVAAALVLVTGVSLLARLSRVARDRASASMTPSSTRSSRSVVVPNIAVEVAAPAASREWTPVPVPRPAYLERRATTPALSAAEVARAAARAEAELSEASEAATRAIRSIEESVPAIAQPRVERPATADSRFASMGVVDAETMPAMPDIDRALRRRRAS